MNKEELQVKSKERVKDHGEVFTNKREVNAMLDLVKDESYRVDSRFLEPACGNGNFLVEILNRKLKTVQEVHSEDIADLQKYIFIAVGSIYAIDIQEDNCQESRHRMYNIVESFYSDLCLNNDEAFLSAIKKVLEMNIILGNGLTGLQVDEDNLDGYADRPIVFSEWTFKGTEILRKDFEMNAMITHNQKKETDKKVKSVGLFGMIDVESESNTNDELTPLNTHTYLNYKEIAH